MTGPVTALLFWGIAALSGSEAGLLHDGFRAEAGTTALVVAPRPGVQPGRPQILTDLDTTAITVGGRIHLSVTVEHDTGTVVVWPDSIDLAPFEVLDLQFGPHEQDGGRIRTSAHLTITAFELGELELPSITARVESPGGSESVDLASDARTVTVSSVGLDEGGDIRDIKGPLEIPRNWILLLPWIGVLALVGAGGYWLYRRFRSEALPGAAVVAEPARPAHEIAYEALARLEAEGLLEKGEIKAHVTAVSEIIRRYVEDRYHVAALEMASDEILEGLVRLGVPIAHRVEFERFLGDCDLVKFAKWIPAMSVCREIIPRAREIVDKTRLVEEARADAGTAESLEAAAPSAAAPPGVEVP